MSIRIGQYGDGVGTLGYRNIETDYSLTHHRTTSQHLVVALRQTATILNHLREWSSHTYEEVARILHLLTGNGGIALEERLVLHNCLINSEGSTYILNYCSNVDWDSWRSRNLTADNGIHQLLLTSLRVLLSQRYNLDTGVISSLFLEEFDGSRLVVLDTDVALLYLCRLHQKVQANENLIGMLHHQAIVGSDIRLALYTVDDDTLCLGSRRRTKLDEGRETGTTHTSDTCHLDTVYNLFWSQLSMSLKRLEFIRAVDTLLPLIAFYINNDARLAITSSINRCIYLEHGSRNGTVNRSTHKTTSLSDECTHLHLVALGNYRLGRSTDVLTKWENSLLRERSYLSSHLGSNLILFWVNSTNSKSSQIHDLVLLLFF